MLERFARRAALLAGLALVPLAGTLPAATLLVQPIQLCDDGGANCANNGRTLYEAETDLIWSQAGIDVQFFNWVTLNSSALLDIGSAAEFNSLFSDPVADPRDNVVSMFFVATSNQCGGTVSGTLFGCAYTPGNRLFITDAVFSFNSGIGRRDTIAHELGHNLGLPHRSDNAADFLMTSGSFRSVPTGVADIVPNGAGLSKLSADEIATARASDLLTPEPSTMLLSMFGFAFALWRRR